LYIALRPRCNYFFSALAVSRIADGVLHANVALPENRGQYEGAPIDTRAYHTTASAAAGQPQVGSFYTHHCCLLMAVICWICSAGSAPLALSWSCSNAVALSPSLRLHFSHFCVHLVDGVSTATSRLSQRACSSSFFVLWGIRSVDRYVHRVLLSKIGLSNQFNVDSLKIFSLYSVLSKISAHLYPY
jgi:hypothetical protein